jgi:hypothetical protein
MNTKEMLIKARARIEKPEQWIQDHMALNVMGFFEEDPQLAVCHCMLGAIKAVTPQSYSYSPLYNALSNVTTAKYNIASIVEFNDTPGRTHAEVLEVFDIAIAEAS